jgi:formate-nitrite transporter family protein
MGKEKNNVVFWLVATIILVLLTLGMIKLATLPKNENTFQSIPAVNNTDHIAGNPQASVTIVEYSDFQCPACGYFFSIIEQLMTKKSDQIRLIYRHFPLKTLHANAEAAAEASEAAAQQGKFWEMHDLLFTKQADWTAEKNPRDKFIGYAESLGLDKTKFTADLKSAAVLDKINNDLAGAYQIGLDSTPTLFINGDKINNPRTYQELANEVDKYLNQ